MTKYRPWMDRLIEVRNLVRDTESEDRIFQQKKKELLLTLELAAAQLELLDGLARHTDDSPEQRQ